MKSGQLRQSFLEFFIARDHELLPSSPLVPKDDPTLLFTSAGMVQFKKFYSGSVPLSFTRACSCQKCLRASDLEEVGRTPKHNTFFEMLGNFSFGDYFKAEAIEWGWEYLTEVLGMDEEKLWVSVFKEDDEAYSIWKTQIGIPPDRIVKLGEKDNFWGPAGETGACGPSSEIHYDLGAAKGCGRTGCAPGCDCDRWVEVWNLVFPQYDQQSDGSRLPLKNRGIDTGLGLERLSAVLQGVDSVFDTDLFLPLKAELKKIFFEECAADGPTSREQIDRAMNVIADHVRALTFTISEGVIPSNEGRGYVLRRLLRRALRQGRILGNESEPFLYRLVPVVSAMMGDVYPELVERRDEVAILVRQEEEKFLDTLERGMTIFTRLAKELKSHDKKQVSGEQIFKLYDTYGFPIDLTRELAQEEGLSLDLKGFDRAMEKQKKMAKEKSGFSDTEGTEEWNVYRKSKSSTFVGYEVSETESKIIQWRQVGDRLQVVLDSTPFYPEAGGQAADRGRITCRSFEMKVDDTFKLEDLIVHVGSLQSGSVADEPVTAVVDVERRQAIQRAHTATHLLHHALRTVLGKETRQEGSLVEEDRLRFDFNRFSPLSPEEFHRVERLVNTRILERHPVEVFNSTREEATKKGAIALFGEKYGEEVRVVQIGDFSMELCGGIHLNNASEVGSFKLVREEPVGAGLRRLEALTGHEAYKFVAEEESVLEELSSALSSPVQELEERVRKLLEEKKQLESEVHQLQLSAVKVLTEELAEGRRELYGFTVVISRVGLRSVDHLRILSDRIRERMGEKTVGVLAASIEGRAKFVAFVSDDIKELHPASAIAKELARMTGGGGGGRSTIAEAGGKDPALIDNTLSKIGEWIQARLMSQ